MHRCGKVILRSDLKMHARVYELDYLGYNACMTVQEWIGLGLALVIMAVGLVGSVLPGLPGTPLVVIAAVAHRLYFGQNSVSNLVLVILVVMMVLSLALDYFAGLLGAKKLGATWRGVLGAALGGLVGIFFGPPGIFLGPFLGAVAFELVGGREFTEATRAGAGAILGLVLGAMGKLACCVAMIGLFVFNVVSRSGSGLG
jgi:uncharacterized protein YqgC (DUF456 family)